MILSLNAVFLVQVTLNSEHGTESSNPSRSVVDVIFYIPFLNIMDFSWGFKYQTKTITMGIRTNVNIMISQ